MASFTWIITQGRAICPGEWNGCATSLGWWQLSTSLLPIITAARFSLDTFLLRCQQRRYSLHVVNVSVQIENCATAWKLVKSLTLNIIHSHLRLDRLKIADIFKFFSWNYISFDIMFSILSRISSLEKLMVIGRAIKSFFKTTSEGKGDGSVGKLVITGAWGPEFGSSASSRKPGVICILTILYEWRHNFWIFLASNLAETLKSKFNERPCLKIQM